MKKTVIAYTNRKNPSKVYTLVSSDEANNTAILTDSNGIEHTMKLTTLRKTFKKSVEEIEEPKTKTKTLTKHQKSALNNVDGERINLRKDEAERLVNIRAFTGMLIGTFKIEEETETSIIVKTSGTKKALEFDKATGIQLNANNKRYANHMEIL